MVVTLVIGKAEFPQIVARRAWYRISGFGTLPVMSERFSLARLY